MKFLVTVF